MKFYSEQLKKLFDTEKELTDAENAENIKNAKYNDIKTTITNILDTVGTNLKEINSIIENNIGDLTSKQLEELEATVVNKMFNIIQICLE